MLSKLSTHLLFALPAPTPSSAHLSAFLAHPVPLTLVSAKSRAHLVQPAHTAPAVETSRSRIAAQARTTLFFKQAVYQDVCRVPEARIAPAVETLRSRTAAQARTTLLFKQAAHHGVCRVPQARSAAPAVETSRSRTAALERSIL